VEMQTIAARIVEARKRLKLTQQQLADRLCVTNKAVSKWERGVTVPDIALLVPLCRILGISVQQLLDDYAETEDKVGNRGCFSKVHSSEGVTHRMHKNACSLHIDINTRRSSSPFIFGHNLEHTRACVSGGLSAQMLRNRKFAGRPQARMGVSSEWFGIGERTYFCNDTDPYVKHYCINKMWRRNELNAQTVQNPLQGHVSGIGQDRLFLQCSRRYIVAFVAKSSKPVALTVQLTDRTGCSIYAEKVFGLETGDWQRYEAELVPCDDDANGCLRFTFTEISAVIFGSISLLPADHFHGMRADVVEKMKGMGIGLLRWPGGNFAGEYRWQDMLLPVDMRAPLQAYLEDETQPYTHGYDMHEIDTDDFIALCREVGAEPFITVNLAWDTPEGCAAWVEYCNGDPDTPYGSLRAARGHAEPYNVQYWSLGNEFGYGHMEGPMQPEHYAALARASAEEMLKNHPGLKLCSSGQYQDSSRSENWVKKCANELAPIVPIVSLHTYNTITHNYTSPEGIRRTYMDALSAVEANLALLNDLRSKLSDDVHISFDEWNLWAAWFRRSSSLEGIYVAKMMHTMLYACHQADAPILCYFEPVGEGAIDIFPDRAEYSADGQAFALLKVHKGAEICKIEGLQANEVVASVQRNILSVTALNQDYDESTVITINRCGGIQCAKLLVASDLLPGSHLDEEELAISLTDDVIRFELPPRSVGLIRIGLKDA